MSRDCGVNPRKRVSTDHRSGVTVLGQGSQAHELQVSCDSSTCYTAPSLIFLQLQNVAKHGAKFSKMFFLTQAFKLIKVFHLRKVMYYVMQQRELCKNLLNSTTVTYFDFVINGIILHGVFNLI